MVKFIVVSAVAFSIAQPAVGGDVVVGTPTPAGQRVSINAVDHSPWDTLLMRFVGDDGLVDYRAWHSDAAARKQLQRYLGRLSSADPAEAAAPAARLAYWINAYNALTIHGILREYPTTSIRNHTATLWGYNLWKNLKLPIAGDLVSLDDIEHRRLRPMGEPRIHFAIVCASIGCPRLLNEAYVPERLGTQLDANARHFFAQPANFRLDEKTVHLSSILKWFGEDFGDSEPRVLARIRPWLREDDAAALSDATRLRVRYLEYDWNLNERERPTTSIPPTASDR